MRPARHRPRLLSGYAFICALCTAAPITGLIPSQIRVARAATPAAQATSVESVEALIWRAKQAFAKKEFEVAAKLFMRAFAKSARADLVYNAARAYEESGELGEAIGLFSLYLSLTTDVDGIAEARDRVRSLRAKQAAKANLAQSKLPGLPAPPTPVNAPEVELSRSPEVAATGLPEVITPEHMPDRESQIFRPNLSAVQAPVVMPIAVERTTAWLVSGAAGVFLLGGLGLVAIGAADAEEANRSNPTTPTQYDNYSSTYDGAERTWRSGAAVAVAGVITGVIAVWLHVRNPTQILGAPNKATAALPGVRDGGR